MKRYLRKATVGLGMLGASLAWSHPSSAAPVYIGLEDSAVNGGAITTEPGSGAQGTLSITDVSYGDFTISASVTGTPPLAEPSLQSSELSAISSGAQTLNLYITGENENVLPAAFLSSFTTNALAAGWSVTETTYVTNCPAGGCTSAFLTTNQLNTYDFSGGGFQALTAAAPGSLATPYEITELYTIVASGADNVTGASSTIDVSAALPLPAALPLFASGLGALGMLGWRRKRKAAVVAAT
jgi:hypothetical protein